jgi:L-arabinose isomerase
MIRIDSLEVWFVTGSQHLYGDEVLKQIAANSQQIVKGLGRSKEIPVKVVFKRVATTPEAIRDICLEANSASQCLGLILWMHTFSPAKMWIAGLETLRKPFVHLHTQFNREIPWRSINMDFMNLNQSAHGDREFGYVCTRLGKRRKVVVGHWQDAAVQRKLGAWTRAAAAWHDSQKLRIARFGDNMRQVAVTQGDPVEAQRRFGYAVNGYGVGDLVAAIEHVPERKVNRLCEEYDSRYQMAKDLRPGGRRRDELRYAARIELGLRSFLEAGGFGGFTDTFEDLHGLRQLPGIAAQRLMADGYGFGAEGDWKTCALVRTMKVMASGLPGGNSFMEDYTYHFHSSGDKVLGAHMLEICESIASGKPSCEIHPLSIGGKEDPVRLVFNSQTGPAVNASVIDMGGRFRLLVNKVKVVKPDQDLPKLPVARALWTPLPDLATAAAAWIHGGGAHHTCLSFALTVEHLEDFAEIAGVEMLLIDESTNLREFQKELRWNDVYYRSARQA